VTSVKDGVVSISGLGAAMAGELIQINNAVEGVSLNVESNAMSLRSNNADDTKQHEQNR
jgi:F0F1-type ATP synthase alpha subunit